MASLTECSIHLLEVILYFFFLFLYISWPLTPNLTSQPLQPFHRCPSKQASPANCKEVAVELHPAVGVQVVLSSPQDLNCNSISSNTNIHSPAHLHSNQAQGPVNQRAKRGLHPHHQNPNIPFPTHAQSLPPLLHVILLSFRFSFLTPIHSHQLTSRLRRCCCHGSW